MAHRRTPQLEADLDDIWYYVAVKSASIEVADRVVDSLAERFSTIARHPHIGRARDSDLRPGLRTFGVGEYLIVYRIDGEEVGILRVVRGTRDLASVLRNL
jgi:toxin ParE1/3/4